MKYGKVVKAEFIERPNRFIAKVAVNGKTETVHVKNTGRCKELLVAGAAVYLEESERETRKTKYDLIAVEKREPDGKIKLINMDSGAPNKAVGEWLADYPIFGKTKSIKPEVFASDSRFDFAVSGEDGSGYVEVKGVTLENDGVVMFPDAPTERGLKHLSELTALAKMGVPCAVVFVVQMEDVRYFTPNRDTHPAFAQALKMAADAGVQVIAVSCRVTPDSMKICGRVKVRL